MKKAKKKKVKYFNIFILFVFIFSLGTFAYSIKAIVEWQLDNKKIEENINKIIKEVEIEEYEVEEDPTTDNNESQEENKKEDKPNQYKDLAKINIMSVDFKDLLKTNPETKGWIKVKGTNINYPFVQTTDNEFYLSHAFDQKKNNAGWLFLDYRNNSDLQDKNNIIYAHNRADSTMFGTLKYTIKSWWYNTKDYYNIKLSTPKYNTVWKVFSTYNIKNTSDYIQVDFKDNEEYKNFITLIKNRSVYDYKVEVTENDRILTLSTCYGSSQKTVLHAKLIKEEKR